MHRQPRAICAQVAAKFDAPLATLLHRTGLLLTAGDALAGAMHIQCLAIEPSVRALQRTPADAGRGLLKTRTAAAANEAMGLLGLQAQLSNVSAAGVTVGARAEEHTSELQSQFRIPYAVFCLKKKKALGLQPALDRAKNRQ